jgi:hypothetical protein
LAISAFFVSFDGVMKRITFTPCSIAFSVQPVHGAFVDASV